MRSTRYAILCLSAFLPLRSAAAQAIQRAQDQTAFTQARAVTEPEARLAALKAFAQAYPGTSLARRAEALELETLLRSFPERTAAIHTLAATEVAAAPAGFERWSEEARLADLLASAGPSGAGLAGADLADAKPWAQDAVAAMMEESYRRQMRIVEAKYKLPPLRAAQRHREFTRTRASFLAALANVDLRAKDLEAADGALAEAGRLDPLSSEGSSLRGQLALLRHRDAEALDQFERAEAEGDLPEPWRGAMALLYRQLHPEAVAAVPNEAPSALPSGLNAEVDALYAKLFPPPFALPPRRLPPGGHTVLLELFTGSGCQPCVAPDLAVESLLGTYTREDLVVLEYDEHIPKPDPLANPDSVNRAALYRVGSTPEAFLDGQELPVMGASRDDAENVVVGFAEPLEDRAAVFTGVQLQLKVRRETDGGIAASAVVSKASPAALPSATDAPAAALPAHPVLRFALVEDHVRYSGENGIRFHRMVVRAMAKSTGPDLTGTSPVLFPAGAAFVPASVDRQQSAYLKSFAKNNDRFGEIEFLSTEIPIDTGHLVVAAWLENPVTHEVLQAAFADVPQR